MAVNQRNGIALSGISAIDGISKATLSAINGQSLSAGGAGVVFDTAIAARFADEAPDGTTGSITPSGSNRWMFGSTSSMNAFGGAPTMTSCKYGGSGGTDLAKIGGVDETFFSGNAGCAVWSIVPGPSGSTTAYGLWSGGIRSAVGASFYTGVNQTTPYDSRTTNTGSDSNTTTVADVTITGINAGDTCVASVEMSSGTDSAAAFTAVAGTTIRAQAASSLLGKAHLEKVSTGSSVTLQVNCNQASTGSITWRAIGVRVIAA